MKNRINISSGAKWEEIIGYSRAVKIGNTIEISGSVALKDGELIGEGDPYLQSIRCLEVIKESLEKLGATLDDVIRTRIFVKDIGHWNEIGKAHGEYFKTIKPATSMVEVNKLINPQFLVEIEASAILQ
jgi:enamine deaminase RidA (YjgF/YER057c/UK114 family)